MPDVLHLPDGLMMPRILRTHGTPDDERWAWRHLWKTGVYECASYRYADTNGIVHRAVWKERDMRQPTWLAICEAQVVDKIVEGDPGPVTCVRCLGGGG